jgi:DNA-binding XRE family transcriptional regulator
MKSLTEHLWFEVPNRVRDVAILRPHCNRRPEGCCTVWTRSFSVSKQPQTIGEHLKKRRFDLGMRQSEAAQRLGVSERTLSQWEVDKVYPTWPFQPRLIQYLGYDPFTDPALGRPGATNPHALPSCDSEPTAGIGQQMRSRRMELKKTRKQCAKELGVSVKTLRGWETGQRQPTSPLAGQIARFLGFSEALAGAADNI